MSKIAIISQADHGVLIDVAGCNSFEEASDYLTSTLHVSSQFWKGMQVDLNLGQLPLNKEEVAKVIEIGDQIGVDFHQVYATNEDTLSQLKGQKVKAIASAINQTADDSFGDSDAPQLQFDGEAPANEVQSDEVQSEGYAQNEETCSGQASINCAPESATATAVAAKPKSEARKGEAKEAVKPVLYLKQNLRAGQAVSHDGHLIIVGDVNPGAEVRAEGDITIWGSLRGVAHAGINGDTTAEIRALRLAPIQIRIAHAIARAPDRPRANARWTAETAKIVNGSIRIQADTAE
jgi:septum site-determining protein MinC